MTNRYRGLFKDNGPLESTATWSEEDRRDTEVFYHHKEKAECALVAMSSWYGGDVFEFGSHDLCTGRNLLTAIHMSSMAKAYPDTKFYFFDAFGKFPVDMGDLTEYFRPYSSQGDQLHRHKLYIQEHAIFTDKCHLVQGLFKDTCTQEFKDAWRAERPQGNPDALHLAVEHREPEERQIGFASLDCNIASSYKTVFEFIFDMMAPNSYIYMDEGLQNPDVMAQWNVFKNRLFMQRGINAHYIRNAGGFGSLWRLFPVTDRWPIDECEMNKRIREELTAKGMPHCPTPGYNS